MTTTLDALMRQNVYIEAHATGNVTVAENVICCVTVDNKGYILHRNMPVCK
jgi:hypothetical protein